MRQFEGRILPNVGGYVLCRKAFDGHEISIGYAPSRSGRLAVRERYSAFPARRLLRGEKRPQIETGFDLRLLHRSVMLAESE